MEFIGSGRSSDHGGDGVKDEKRSESTVGDDVHRSKHDESAPEDVIQESRTNNTQISLSNAVPSATSTKKEEVDELESTKAEMGEVIEENQRLKMSLNQILNDYRTLQMQFHTIVQKETKNSHDDHKVNNMNNTEDMLEESELVSLSLGRLPSNNPRNDEKAKVSGPLLREEEYKEGLALGLECKFETSKSGSINEVHLPNSSPTNSIEAPKEEAGETWPPSKVLKTSRDNVVEDEVPQQNPTKKARVCVRARCDTPTLNDGCQWRKYGQKISKGNPCPRAYYRCTVSPSCPVRKQVQRCSQDMSILITTYEGTHNHTLPLSATAMASTTSAAASMLLSGSSTSQSVFPSTTTPNSANLHGMNFYLQDGSKSKQFYLSHPSLSSSPSHPTITIDLTSNPSSSSSSPFGRFASNYNPPRYNPSSTLSLNFNSSESNSISWSNGILNYNSQQPYNNRNMFSTVNLGRVQPNENIYNSYMKRNNNISNNPMPHQGSTQQHSLPDTIAEATKVITADPNFQSALAAALTSIIGTGNGKQLGNHEILGQKMKLEELFPESSTSKVSGCASTFLNKATDSAQKGSLMFLPPPLPFSSTKSASSSPSDNRDNTN